MKRKTQEMLKTECNIDKSVNVYVIIAAIVECSQTFNKNEEALLLNIKL